MTSFVEKTYWIWLSNVPGIGPRRFFILLKLFETPKAVWESSADEVLKYKSVLGEKTIQSIIENKQLRYLDKAAEILENKEIFVLTLIDEEYPVDLKNTIDPPPVLYCKGKKIDSESFNIAIVGSRKTSEHGRQMAERFSHDLALSGMGIISGAARGIDTMAHRGALNANGNTIAVLGCGIDVVYPPDNKKIFSQIEEKGTLLSEYPPGTTPLPSFFPARNRIISGLSKVILVIEAGEKSGALITVDFALEQGKEIFVVPGNLNNPYCIGSNRLLKDGARLVTTPNEIIEELGIEPLKSSSVVSKSKTVQLDLFELEVYNTLEEGEKHIEDVVFSTGFHIGKINSIFTMLEIKGLVKQLPGNIFVRR